MRKAYPSNLVRLTAMALTAALALPNPAWALRTEARSEAKSGLEELEAALLDKNDPGRAVASAVARPIAGALGLPDSQSSPVPSVRPELSRRTGLEEYKIVPITQEYGRIHGEELAAIEKGVEVWDREGHWGPDRFSMDNRPSTGTSLKDLWQLSFAAEDSNGVPVAYIYTTNGQPDYPVALDYPGIFIFRLSVRLDAQGKKLGTQLLLRSALAARDAGIRDHITLETDENNIGSKRLYESLGFENLGTRFDSAKGIHFVEYAVKIDTLIDRAEQILSPAGGLAELSKITSAEPRQIAEAAHKAVSQTLSSEVSLEQNLTAAVQAIHQAHQQKPSVPFQWLRTGIQGNQGFVGFQVGEHPVFFRFDGEGIQGIAVNETATEQLSYANLLGGIIGPKKFSDEFLDHHKDEPSDHAITFTAGQILDQLVRREGRITLVLTKKKKDIAVRFANGAPGVYDGNDPMTALWMEPGRVDIYFDESSDPGPELRRRLTDAGMQIKGIFSTPEAVGEAVAAEILPEWQQKMLAKGNYVFGLVTGTTPRPFLAALMPLLKGLSSDVRSGLLQRLTIVVPDDHVEGNSPADFRNITREHPVSAYTTRVNDFIDPANEGLAGGGFPVMSVNQVIVPEVGQAATQLQAVPGIDRYFLTFGPQHIFMQFSGEAQDVRLYDPAQLVSTGLEEWQGNNARLHQIIGLAITIMQDPERDEERVVKQSERDVINALIEAFRLGTMIFERQDAAKVQEFTQDWLDLIYILTERRFEGQPQAAEGLREQQSDEEWKADVFLRLVVANGVTLRFKQSPAPNSMAAFALVVESEYVSTIGAIGRGLQDQMISFSEPLVPGVVARVAEVIQYPRSFPAGLEERPAAFRKMLEDADWKLHFASPGFVALDTERKAALDIPAEATAFIVSDEAAISTDGHRIFADNRLTHPDRPYLIWTPSGTGAQEVVRFSKQKGAKQGDLLLIPPDAGVTIDSVEALLRDASYAADLSDAPRVVIGGQAQVEATALSTLWFLASHAELPRVVFLNVGMKLTDEAGNSYTLILMV